MTGDHKALKLLCLADLVFGLASMSFGVLLLAQNPLAETSWACATCAFVSLFLGIRGAMLANVPSNARQVSRVAAICSLLVMAASVLLFASSAAVVLMLIVAVVAFALSIAIFLVARRLADAQEKA
ncbi:hypothetical protein [Olsenella urininfantis]|uniref:hypothetical protein n=1 Tax=Olsenella urininfantis TaxID=1871033 RepID=UPI0009877308|nr:hypothetical protein [Olsenella urininfantis]